MNPEEIKKIALKELEQENIRLKIDQMKQKLKTKKTLFQRIFPWKIILIRR